MNINKSVFPILFKYEEAKKKSKYFHLYFKFDSEFQFHDACCRLYSNYFCIKCT